MNELSLFTGAGGGLLGSLLLGWRTIGYVEKEEYCQKIIRQRIKDGILHEAPIFGDVRSFIGEGYADGYKGLVDVVTAGFPCQPFSVAGKRQGELDDRNMWPDTIETIRRVRPRYAFLENVPGLLAVEYFGTILKDLAESGYGVRWKCISAGELGAPHRRDRLWIAAFRGGPVSDSEGRGCGFRSTEDVGKNGGEGNAPGDGGEILADTAISRLERQEPEGRAREHNGLFAECHWWDSDPADVGDTGSEIGGAAGAASETIHRPEAVKRPGRSGGNGNEGPAQPRLGRVADGVADRVDRLKAIGNGQVPAVVQAAWKLLTDGI